MLEELIENLTEYIYYAFPKEFIEDAFKKYLEAYEDLDDSNVEDKINHRDTIEMYNKYMDKFKDRRIR